MAWREQETPDYAIATCEEWREASGFRVDTLLWGALPPGVNPLGTDKLYFEVLVVRDTFPVL